MRAPKPYSFLSPCAWKCTCVKLYTSINVQVAPYIFFKTSCCIPYLSFTSISHFLPHMHETYTHIIITLSSWFLLLWKLWKWKCVTQLCPAVCNPLDCSPPASSVHGILQARILERVAIPFSRGSSPLPRIFFPKELIEELTLLSRAQQTFPIHPPPGEVREI